MSPSKDKNEKRREHPNANLSKTKGSVMSKKPERYVKETANAHADAKKFVPNSTYGNVSRTTTNLSIVKKAPTAAVDGLLGLPMIGTSPMITTR